VLLISTNGTVSQASTENETFVDEMRDLKCNHSERRITVNTKYRENAEGWFKTRMSLWGTGTTFTRDQGLQGRTVRTVVYTGSVINTNTSAHSHSLLIVLPVANCTSF